jgi:hypothetical protein
VLWLSKQDNHSNNATHGVVVVGAPSFETPVMVGHVVSLIQCGKVASVTGFLDAAAVLRHSIHSQPSRYGYEMYAIVHTDCQHHAPLLQRMGYTPLVRDSPVLVQDIKDGWYKDHVEGENCCGSKEFIKLYAYELEQHPVLFIGTWMWHCYSPWMTCLMLYCIRKNHNEGNKHDSVWMYNFPHDRYQNALMPFSRAT